ncbi:hypothetical protein BDY24DRAFT_393602 [Mrakia frigida]|uniref:uncharacterized protein n=1 Tax=Mrakia frigida TaxID=29902 RepID=UPI003FCC141E
MSAPKSSSTSKQKASDPGLSPSHIDPSNPTSTESPPPPPILDYEPSYFEQNLVLGYGFDYTQPNLVVSDREIAALSRPPPVSIMSRFRAPLYTDVPNYVEKINHINRVFPALAESRKKTALKKEEERKREEKEERESASSSLGQGGGRAGRELGGSRGADFL